MARLDDQLIGWQGIHLSVPEDWSMTAFGGDGKEGSMRIDAANPDSKLAPAGMELRWRQHPKAQTVDMLEQRLAPMFKKATQTARRNKTEVETWSGAVENHGGDNRPAELAFRMRSDVSTSGRIWYCSECGRVVVAQVYGRGGIRFKDVAGRMLSTIGCHGVETGWRQWSLYGLSTSVPATWDLKGQQLMNVYLRLAFALGRSEDLLTVEQWSLATVQLANKYLDEWFTVRCESTYRHLTYDVAEDEVNGHPALRLTGKRGGILYWLMEGIGDLLRLRLPALFFDGLLWECPDSNKVYLVAQFTRKRNQGLIKDIADRTDCHVR